MQPDRGGRSLKAEHCSSAAKHLRPRSLSPFVSNHPCRPGHGQVDRECSRFRVSDPRARLASARLPVRDRASALPFPGRRPRPGVNADPAGLPLPLPGGVRTVTRTSSGSVVVGGAHTHCARDHGEESLRPSSPLPRGTKDMCTGRAAQEGRRFLADAIAFARVRRCRPPAGRRRGGWRWRRRRLDTARVCWIPRVAVQ